MKKEIGTTRVLVWGLLAVLSFGAGGCGTEGEGQKESMSQAGQRKTCDLSAGEWKAYGEIEDNTETWFASGYWDDLVLGADVGTERGERLTAADDGKFYILESVRETGEQTAWTYWLTEVGIESLQAERIELELSDMGKLLGEDGADPAAFAEAVERGHVEFTGLDALDGKLTLFAVRMEDRRTAEAYAFELTENGRFERAVDLLPGLEQAGRLEDSSVTCGFARDREGRFYIDGGPGSGICVLDTGGMFLARMGSPGGTESLNNYTSRLPNGSPVFECVDPDSQTLTVFCFDEGGEKILYRGSGELATARFLNASGEILWLGHNGMMRWNAAEGSCECFYRDNGLSATDCEAILEGSEGEIFVACHEGGGTSIYRLQPGREAETIQVRVFQLMGDEGMKEYAAEYSRKHPGTEIMVEACEPGDDKEILLNRLMAQMTSGGGPDILVLNREHLEILQERGVLAELSEALPDELKEQIFGSVLRQGTIKDGLYGIARQVSVSTLLVPQEVWQEETWNFRDVLGLMEEREGQGKPCDRCVSVSYSLTADQMLFYLALLDMGGTSSLVDMERGQCFFNTPEFIRLLETCKMYGEASGSREYMTDEERCAEVDAGKALAFSVDGDLKGFSSAMALCGDDYRCVGYPTEGNCGSRVSCYQLATVNAGTGHYEIAVDFLNYLLSKEIQSDFGTSSVRRDVLTEGVAERAGDTPVFRQGGNNVIPLEGKPDGSSYLQEYMELVERGTPETWTITGIRSIVMEEALAFFNGDKSAEAAASLIQNRVQLYLDEK